MALLVLELCESSVVSVTRNLAHRYLSGALLESVLFRVGVLAALRSKKLDGKTIGVMVTASHNPEQVLSCLASMVPPSVCSSYLRTMV